MTNRVQSIRSIRTWSGSKFQFVICLLFLTGCDNIFSHDSPPSTGAIYSTPTGVYASPGAGTGKIVLQLDSEKESSSYNIYISTTPGVRESKYRSKRKSAKAAYLFTGLTSGKTYYFTVSAGNGAHESSMSGEVSATVP